MEMMTVAPVIYHHQSFAISGVKKCEGFTLSNSLKKKKKTHSVHMEDGSSGEK